MCRKLFTLVCIMALMCFLIEQYVEPTIQNTKSSLQKVIRSCRFFAGQALLSRYAPIYLHVLSLQCALATYPDMHPLWKQRDFVRIAERLLKLAIPSLYVWLLIFAALFHVGLNIVAEITLFGDREFYKVQVLTQAAVLICPVACWELHMLPRPVM